MRGNQVARQWIILRIIEGCTRGRTVQQLHEDTGIPTRTIYRDLQALCDGGFPLYPEKEGRDSYWTLTSTHKKSGGFPLTPTELMALHVACDLLTSFRGTFIEESIQGVFEKVKAYLTDERKEFVKRISEAIHVGAFPKRDYGAFDKTMGAISDAVSRNKRIRMTYTAISTGRTTRRRVDPYHVLMLNGSVYLIGYCHLRKQVRTFALERIKELETLDAGFTVPKDFSLDIYLQSAFKIMTGEPEWVRIKFDAAVAHTVSERVWHPTQHIEKRPDGSLEVALRVPINYEIISWVLGFGPSAEVLEPDHLRKTLKKALGEAFRLY
jgi:predicted DNA-binding transcriptional regulator YafY